MIAIPNDYGGAAKTNLSRGVTGNTGHGRNCRSNFSQEDSFICKFIRSVFKSHALSATNQQGHKIGTQF